MSRMWTDQARVTDNRDMTSVEDYLRDRVRCLERELKRLQRENAKYEEALRGVSRMVFRPRALLEVVAKELDRRNA